MAEATSGSFNSFWQRGMDKVSSKTVKFMPNVTKPRNGKDEEETDDSNLTQKQRRRAQVRKAQIEHRQRKQNYTIHLEQDVISLREMIAAAESQTLLFRDENDAIKSTLTKFNIPIQVTLEPAGNINTPEIDFSNLNDFERQVSHSEMSTSGSPNHQDINRWFGGSSKETLVTVNFDELIDASCLQICSPTLFGKKNDVNTDVFLLPDVRTTTSASEPQQVFSTLAPDLSKSLPKLPHETQDPPQIQEDTSTIAINFILALEHPCRTHFSPPSQTFNPLGDPSGHQLMASTYFYSHAPSSIFPLTSSPDLTNLYSPSNPNAISSVPHSTHPVSLQPITSWSVPNFELSNLLEMSNSLPKGDWEITPVQVWFMLVERYGVERLVKGVEAGKVREELKKGLSKLVGCWEFGAVVDVDKFWAVAESVIGVGG